jgi:hypothetical protein
MRELPVGLFCRICENRKQTYLAATSPQHEGRIGRSSRHVGRVAMDAEARRRCASTRTAKACGRGPPTLGSSLRTICGRRRLTSPVLRRERAISRKPLRRECRSDFGVPVLASRAFFLFCTQGSGCVVHPAFPAPSHFGGTRMRHHSDAFAPRECCFASSPLSSSSLTGRPSIPEAAVLEPRSLWDTGSSAFADDDAEVLFDS